MDANKLRELRARLRQGQTVPIEELREALDAIRQDRMALIGAKPPKAKAAKKTKEEKAADEQAALFVKLFGAPQQAPAQKGDGNARDTG